MTDYHTPVLLKESVDQLVEDPDGIYMDLTFGGGGHSREILKKLGAKGRLIVFDQDIETGDKVPEDDRLTFIKANFRYMYRFWKWMQPGKIDGILADLGVSSHQFDADYRGFSYRYDSPLDMRMNEASDFTAGTLLNSYEESRLQQIFSRYGEIRNARTLAGEIVRNRRQKGKIETTGDLNRIVEPLAYGDRIKYLSQVYQALRIEVNEELEAIGEMLTDSLKVLKKGGRIVVISYHSLEDRLIKRFLKSGNIEGKMIKDEYGNLIRGIKMKGKLILPSQEEQRLNSRSRSAKMRVGLKI